MSYQAIENGLASEYGFAVIPDFLTEDEVRRLNEDFDRHRPQFRRARIGRGTGAHESDAVRRDEIFWFEPEHLTPGQALLWERLEDLRLFLNRRLFLGLKSLEGHFASYPPGGFYRKHLDRFRDDDSRVISLVVYLNENWREGDGGELLLREATRISPRAGTLVCFRSDTVEHEVLRSRVERRSFAGWLRGS